MFDRKLVRTRFVGGLKFNINLLRKSDEYLENKFRIISLGGLGYGVLHGYKESLALSIEGGILVIKSGAAIDREGNLIYVPSTEIIKNNIKIVDFTNRSLVYVYIKHKEEQGGEVKHINQEGNIKSEFVSSYHLSITEDKQDDKSKEWIELGRITIDYNKIAKNGTEYISEPFNPFLPRDNEIDVRFVPRIETNLVGLDDEKNIDVYRTLGSFSDYLNDISFKYKLFSASVASSFIYQMREDIYTNNITPYGFYQKLKEGVRIVEKIKEENPQIIESDFWININQLKNLFNIGFGKRHNEKIDFYKFDTYETTYFGRILNHFKSASLCSKDLKFEHKEELKEEPKHKGYVQVGRSTYEKNGNDIYEDFINDMSVSRLHLIVTVEGGGIWIEDQKSKHGTTVNGEKILPKTKKFVRRGDIIVLGKQNSKLSLNHTKIQELLNL